MNAARRAATLFVLLSALFPAAVFAAAADAAAGDTVTLDQVQHPALLVKTTRPGVFLEAPTVRTEISLRIRGIVARALVRQTFENKTDHCVEAIYVFPLADDATVDAMRLRVGTRTIEGVIKEREEAAKVYEEARSEGRQASLLEQHRPDLFTVSVASLSSGETAEVEIEYQQIVTYDDGHFSLRLPLAIGPRYQPAGTTSPLPPMRHEPASATRNPVELEIDLDAGIPLASILSPTHELAPVPLSATRTQLTPRNVEIASDRDFELVWTPRLGALPQSTAFTETSGGHRYTLLMLFPPDLAARPAAVLPRETTFIIDTSGSMAGPSLDQAKQALLSALRRLRPSDSFNVIEFNSTATRLFDQSRPADRESVGEALRWVGKLESTGGTEMMSALRLAFEDAPARADVVRQVVFITDGEVGNETQVFGYISAHLGDARVFTIGIGAAPNSYFMRNAARAGRGTFTNIRDIAEVETEMTALFRKLESPVLSNLALHVEPGVEVWPAQLPDLYAGEPLVVALRGDKPAAGRVTANGWNQAFSATALESPSGLARLWARQKIDTVRDSIFTGANPDDVRKQIVALALEHHLVTEHTSLVAVDTTPAGIDAQSCKSELVPINLPVGWGGMEGGALPQTGTASRLWMVIGAALLMVALVVRRWS
jgi:Ca-activated chloride channel homolog